MNPPALRIYPSTAPSLHRITHGNSRHTTNIDHGRDRQRITFVESGSPLSEWTIKITYSYDITPTIGHKLADQNGKTMLV